MKRILLPLVALTLLLGACSSSVPTASNRAAPPPGPAIRTGTKVTAWGELPSYDARGHYFKNMRAPRGVFNGKLTLDLLVNADGTVEEVAVFESSGNAVFDRSTADQFKKARYTLQLGADDPAPYVVRFTVVSKINESGSRIPMDNNSMPSQSPPTTILSPWVAN